MIHFTNGDSVRDPLLEAGIDGDVVIFADVLHQGPCPSGLSAEAFDDVRAQYLAGEDYGALSEIRASFAERARAVTRAATEDEIVLWFEHDLFDQLNLLWLLDRFRQGAVPVDRVRLIVVGEFPGVTPFHGLGQLSAAQLMTLFPGRVPLLPGQLAYAADVWAAVCHPTPERIVDFTRHARAPLEFVPTALFRLLEELPGHLDGLSRTERQGLAAFATGARNLHQAFHLQAQQEAAIFLGDLSFFRAMRHLETAAVPLLHRESERVMLTGDGVAVLAGDADHAALNGLDRWVGGTHLTGRTPHWRWNPERGVIVEQ